MSRWSAIVPLALAGAALLWLSPVAAYGQTPLHDALKGAAETYRINGRPVPMRPIRLFYEERGYLPAWTSPDGLSERGVQILEFLRDSGREGLDPDDYSITVATGDSAAEIALSAALLRYATDVQAGREKPEQMDPDLFVARDDADRTGILRNAATAPDIIEFLETLPPRSPEYTALRRMLARYRNIADGGGWGTVPGTTAVKRGYTGPETRAIRERLEKTGDIASDQAPSDTFDATLEQGVIRFQRRHGLTADGVVGARTQAALNVPVAQRIRQIEINMERWRWMPDDLGNAHVFVNLAGFDLRAVRNDETVLTMPVIVGRPYRRTPVFSDRISYMEVNPDWTVPYKIATQDILPKLQADPSYLAANGFRVLPAGGGAPLDPQTIDWHRYDRRNFPFQLRQLPGPLNALGQIKFMFPNKFAVYLHDTPARELFSKDVRMFSSGCIRVGQPMDLAMFLLAGDPAWTRHKLHREVETGRTKVIRLRATVPVHLSYLTAWVAADGTAQFRGDIYDRDARLVAALYPAAAK